jgi:mono/diheme cytochrome c family protein
MADLRFAARITAVMAGLSISSTAMALPWDIDLVDAYFFRGYEWNMMTVPEGAVSMNRWAPNYDRMTPEGQGLRNPYNVDAAQVATGEKMFNTYCAACHGKNGGKGGAPVADNTSGMRYPILPPMLSGDGAITGLRSDGYLYLTIRNGAAVMSGYGQAMDDDEMWAIVSYIRTLDGAAYTGGL